VARTKIVRFSVIDEIVAQLEDAITTGEYAPGAKLPGEGEMAAQLEVSRPVVREALARLRERGYVHTINGRGTFVRESGLDTAAEALLRQVRLHVGTHIEIDDLYDVRRVIEMRTAGLAAENANSRDIQALTDELTAMRTSLGVDAEAFSAADAAFHLAIATASHNPLYSLLLAPVVDLIVKSIYQSVRANLAHMESGVRDHERIVERIKRGDAIGAVEEIRGHLIRSREMHTASHVELRPSNAGWPKAVRMY
jgi:GntR family transcriptional repressor for pyruvate dehydrogenase complex